MKKPASRQAKVTDENREEARKLKAIWDAKKPMLKERGLGSQEAFGDKFEIGNQSAVGHFLLGNSALSLKAALGFAKGLECEIGEFSPRLAKLVAELAEANGPLKLTEEEARLIRRVRSLGPDGLGRIAAYADGLASAESTAAVRLVPVNGAAEVRLARVPRVPSQAEIAEMSRRELLADVGQLPDELVMRLYGPIEQLMIDAMHPPEPPPWEPPKAPRSPAPAAKKTSASRATRS